ncbi:hypothetical protein H4S07_006376, partial [Coemansia furcata]
LAWVPKQSVKHVAENAAETLSASRMTPRQPLSKGPLLADQRLPRIAPMSLHLWSRGQPRSTSTRRRRQTAQRHRRRRSALRPTDWLTPIFK